MSLSQEHPPDGIEEELREFLSRRFVDVATQLALAPSCPPRKQMPYKPQVGAIHYFNDPANHDYDPAITGEGFWGLTSAGWVLFG